MPSRLGPHGAFGAADFAVGEGARTRQKAHDGQGGQGLSRPGLAHDARGLAWEHLARDLLDDRLCLAESDGHPVDGQEGDV